MELESFSPYPQVPAICPYPDLYSSPNIIRVIKSTRMRWAGHVACMSDRRVAYKVLAGKPDCKRPLGSPRPRWENNIKIDLQ
jgi:hypothetical protein